MKNPGSCCIIIVDDLDNDVIDTMQIAYQYEIQRFSRTAVDGNGNICIC